MSKNTKRQARRAPVAPSTTTTTVASTPSSRLADREFSPDYGPVKKDLRRIGVLAGGFITLLVVLSFFLR